MKQEQMMQKYFQILGDANRLRVINYIGKTQRTVSEIVQETGLSQPLVSHHLKVLRDNQILETIRDGPFVYHTLKNPKLLDVLGLFWELVAKDNPGEDDDLVFKCPHIWKRMLENMFNFPNND